MAGWFRWNFSPALVTFAREMIGTLINVAAIVTGGAIGTEAHEQFSHRTEYRIKIIPGVH